MKISPVSNVSFERLYLKDPVKSTVDALSSVIKNTETFMVLQDTFKKIDENTGNSSIFLQADKCIRDGRSAQFIRIEIKDDHGNKLKGTEIDLLSRQSTVQGKLQELQCFALPNSVLQSYCQSWTQYNRNKSSSSPRSVFYNKG